MFPTTNIVHQRPVSVTVVSQAAAGDAHPRQVVVTPLPASCASASASEPIAKVLLKAVSKAAKGSSHKLFTLRHVDARKMLSCEEVKRVIRSQLKEDIVLGDFDVGFLSGNNVITIRSAADLNEFWSDFRAGKKVMLWCDGLREAHTTNSPSTSASDKRKRGHNHSAQQLDSDEENYQLSKQPAPKRKRVSAEEREDRVQSTIDKLKEKHGPEFTPMQFRIWSEMIVGGIHSSIDNPPTSAMFTRAGKGVISSKKKDDSVAEALTHAALTISSALSPTTPGKGTVMGTSPVRLIESRSKCYKQLHDLNTLKVSGVLSEEEYDNEKGAVLRVLKKLSGD